MPRTRIGSSAPLSRVAAVACVAAATALALTGCSGSSAAGGVPGAPKSSGASAGAATIDQLVAAEKPAAASQLPKGSTAAKIKDKGTLTVGGTQTAALFSLLNPTTGKVDGFDAAMYRLLAKYIIGKDSTKLVNVTSQTREALLKNHSVDAVFATYTITPEREKEVAFAGPYYEDGLAIETKSSGSKIPNLADLSALAHKTVVTQSGSTAATEIKKAAPSAKVQLFDTNTECLQALQQGRADAYVLDQGILAGNASTHPDVKVLPRTFTKEPYGIGLPHDRPDFKSFVNKWLQKMEDDGTWAKVWKATVGTQVPGAIPSPPAVG